MLPSGENGVTVDFRAGLYYNFRTMPEGADVPSGLKKQKRGITI
jgi:hypothetical protein